MSTNNQRTLHDVLGRELTVGQPVAFFHRNRKHMQVGRVLSTSRVNVTIIWTNGHHENRRRIRSTDVAIVDEDAYVFNLLRTGVG
jgi:hypothetical protein